MTVNVYSSFDAGAPSLTGEVGSLISVLDACLVTGYGAKSAAGWTKPFVGTNIAVFRPGAGEQAYFQIKDDGVEGTNGAKCATVYVYATMSDADTGTDKTPSAYTTSHFHHIAKSTTLDSAAREWKVYASNKACYILVKTGVVVVNAYYTSFFGEYNRINPTYGKASIISACNAASVTGAAHPYSSLYVNAATSIAGDSAHLLHDGVLPSRTGGLLSDSPNASSTIIAFRNSAMVFSPIMVRSNETISSAFAILGFIPGAFTSYAPYAANDTVIEFTNGIYAGRSFVVATGMSNSASNFTCIYIEITPGAW